MNPYHGYARLYQGIFRLVSGLLPWRSPEVLEGSDSVLRLPRRILDDGVNRVLLVTDASLTRLGLTASFLREAEHQGLTVVPYDRTVPNPTIQNIEEALLMYQQHRCEGLVGFGGGSALDCAKGVAARMARPDKSLSALRGVLRVRRPTPPLYAVPTTAGTGSEATLAAVVSDPATHDKYAINDPVLIPRVAVLDPRLTLGLPPAITAATGMDALTHAVEAFIGRSNTPQTEMDAIKATRAIMHWLPRVMEYPGDPEARNQMLQASFLAGRSFTRAYVGNVHAMAHTLGGFYGIAHGLANAVILPLVLEAYGNVLVPRLGLLARRADVVGPGAPLEEGARVFIERIRDMNRRFGHPEGFPAIREEDLPAMIDHAWHEANPLYPVPRIFDREDFETLYRRLMVSRA